MIDPSHLVGKYGAYIWPAYAVSLVGLGIMIVDVFARARHWRGEVDRLRRGLASDERDDQS